MGTGGTTKRFGNLNHVNELSKLIGNKWIKYRVLFWQFYSVLSMSVLLYGDVYIQGRPIQKWTRNICSYPVTTQYFSSFLAGCPWVDGHNKFGFDIGTTIVYLFVCRHSILEFIVMPSLISASSIRISNLLLFFFFFLYNVQSDVPHIGWNRMGVVAFVHTTIATIEIFVLIKRLRKYILILGQHLLDLWRLGNARLMLLDSVIELDLLNRFSWLHDFLWPVLLTKARREQGMTECVSLLSPPPPRPAPLFPPPH